MNYLRIIPILCLSLHCSANEKSNLNEFYGTYGNSHKKLIIYPGSDTAAVVYVGKTGGAPNYNSSNLFGKVTLKGGVLHHSSLLFNSEDFSCKFTISLNDKLATIATLTSDSKCGFLRYTLSDSFMRSSETPQKEVKNIFTGGICPLEFLAKQLRKTDEFILKGCYKN